MPEHKFAHLKTILKDMKSILIAYSGGVDSTLLLKTASEVLGDRVLAVTARSETYPFSEIENVKDIISSLGVKHRFIDTHELENPSFFDNPPERCYFCKKELFSKLIIIAEEEGYNFVLDGSNIDDLKDFRPGMKAAEEFGIRSPLRESGFTKGEIRNLSLQLGIPTWDKPATPCLSSRFPYGMRITRELLKMVEEAEAFIRGLGYNQVRVRHYGDIAKIEIEKNDIDRFMGDGIKAIERLRKIGYSYVCLDLRGYRSGSMNDALKL